MKIVLDTNVLVSGIFFSGAPYEILKSWRYGIVQLVFSPAILSEYIEVAKILNKKHSEVNIQKIIDLLTVKSELVISPDLPGQISKDPADDKFISCALFSKVKIVVSGDKHLLELNGYENLEIISPREFLNKYL